MPHGTALSPLALRGARAIAGVDCDAVVLDLRHGGDAVADEVERYVAELPGALAFAAALVIGLLAGGGPVADATRGVIAEHRAAALAAIPAQLGPGDVVTQ